MGVGGCAGSAQRSWLEVEVIEGEEVSDNPSVGAASERVDSDELGSWVVVKLGGVAAGFIGVVHAVGVVADATHIEVVAGVVIVGGKG